MFSTLVVTVLKVLTICDVCGIMVSHVPGTDISLQKCPNDTVESHVAAQLYFSRNEVNPGPKRVEVNFSDAIIPMRNDAPTPEVL